MAFDTDTRNKLAKMVADARALLNDEFTQQLQEIFGIQPDGKITALEKLAHLDDEQCDTARVLRERVAHISGGLNAGKKAVKVAVDRLIREQSFTILNRFAALRMCEERGLLQQCVGDGLQSKGFQVYLKTAGSSLGGQYERYRTFIFSIFDEIAIDLGILFDRFSPLGLLFPREARLGELLEVINRKELNHIWGADEAIGWIYQYFNSSEERKAMRKASAAPRNSRELAVRNQFFTPRYVVEFLTENTLGRIWYEMRQGDTALKENCRYLVRRPEEVFLEKGQEPPEEDETSNENLSQEELLNKTAYIPFRAPKDSRDLKILDPACGSGHFLLYAFDILETIYEEAWQYEDSPPSNATGKSLTDDFESLHELRTAIPELILHWNLHGIDIDPRAVQIATLALWLRAQRSWQKQGIKVVERPRLSKSNIVCAEPMPGDENMLKAFIDDLKPKVLGQLVEVIFDKMRLAGEAGSLLKIEEEIKDAIAEARKQWEDKPKYEQAGLFPELQRPTPKQQELQFDVRDIDDAKFWDRAESMILQSLQKYAERSENGLENQRKMFAEDAAQGFAFIDICRKRFDVVLMNPPYGAGTDTTKSLLSETFPSSWIEVYICFCERAVDFCPDGLIGALTSRTWMYLQKFIKFRKRIIDEKLLSILADLGSGILDDATVEIAAWIYLPAPQPFSAAIFIKLTEEKNQESDIYTTINKINFGLSSSRSFIHSLNKFSDSSNCSITYDSTSSQVPMVIAGNEVYKARPGLGTRDDFRFARLRWEVNPIDVASKNWACAIYGSQESKFYADHNMVINWADNGRELRVFIAKKYGSASRSIINEDVYYKPGCTYQYTGKTFRVHVLPKNSIITMAGQGLYPMQNSWIFAILGLLNSTQATIALKKINPGRFFQASYVNSLKLNTNWLKSANKLEELAKTIFYAQRKLHSFSETSLYFCLESLKEFKQSSNAHNQSLLKTIKQGMIEIDKLSENIFMLDQETILEKSARTDYVIFDESPINIGIILGFVFGRWDIRYLTGKKQTPRFSDPFESLPICPPGMLQNDKGLPAVIKDVPKDYPIRINWDGILVDDEGHIEDILARVREAFEVIWGEKAGDIEQEVCNIIGAQSLRSYFHKPNNFFANHFKRYSKNRRKAPIYWPLSTESGSYTLWLYYPRLTDQSLFTCVTDYVNPKIETTSKEIERFQKELSKASNAQKRDKLDKLQDFRQELIDFRDELLRVAKLPYKPNLNDGVLITASPLWKLFRLKKWQNDLKACWEKLETGEYDWAHLAHSIWPERVREKCKTDRSIAIAHDLEHLCEVEPKKKKRG